MATSRTNKQAIRRLNAAISPIVAQFAPPEDLTTSEWADKNRVLASGSSAEPGPWRTSRTPYLKEPMDSFSDPKIRRIVMAASSQVGKSEFILNCIGDAIDQDPDNILFVQPDLGVARKFSKQRVAPMMWNSKRLRGKVAEVKSRDSSNTTLEKSYPGGILSMVGSQSAAALASTPVRYVFGDERDRWAASAGTEGDPWALTVARQLTFYNAKSVEVSTPTVKGHSNIENSYLEGTQERWHHQCPDCGEWHEITFSSIRFTHEVTKVRGKKHYRLTGPVEWLCPNCGCLSPQSVMRRQPAKWVAQNPDALKDGIRSFWLSAFASPWADWGKDIVLKFLEAGSDAKKLQVVYNTLLGELWEDRGDVDDEETLLTRLEDYGTMEDGKTPADLPEGVLVLTCGVDTQDDRLEYEVLGHGRFGETWGILRGFISGIPKQAEVWEGLDAIIDRVYYFANGRGLKISVTFVDSGGHYTKSVYAQCRARFYKKVFAIKGANTDDAPYIRPPKKQPIDKNAKITCWRYLIGVNAGKADIMNSLRVQEPGANYCHFPKSSPGDNRGYNYDFFNGLLAEKLVRKTTTRGDKWVWERLPGHPYNEPLDCRNYALAARQIMAVDLDKLEQKIKETMPKQPPIQPKRKRGQQRQNIDEW